MAEVVAITEVFADATFKFRLEEAWRSWLATVCSSRPVDRSLLCAANANPCGRISGFIVPVLAGLASPIPLQPLCLCLLAADERPIDRASLGKVEVHDW